MKNLLALVGLIVVAFGGLGWYFGWYNVILKTGTDGKVNVSADIDSKKIAEDAKKFGEKVGKVIQNDDTPSNFMGPQLPDSMKTKPAETTVPSISFPNLKK
jgi:hypothetical protein